MITILPQRFYKGTLSLVFTFLIFSLSYKTAAAASIYLSPASGSYSGNFDVTINVDPQGASVSGVDVVLKYEPDKLEVQLIQNGVFEQYLMKSNDKTTGSIAVRTYNTSTLVTSIASVAKITFKPLVSTGTTTITVLYTPTQTDESNVVSGGSDILSSVSGSTITLQGAAVPPAGNTGVGTTTPPVVTTPTTPKQPTVPTTGDPYTATALVTVSLGLIASGIKFLKTGARSN